LEMSNNAGNSKNEIYVNSREKKEKLSTRNRRKYTKTSRNVRKASSAMNRTGTGRIQQAHKTRKKKGEVNLIKEKHNKISQKIRGRPGEREKERGGPNLVINRKRKVCPEDEPIFQVDKPL